jgi:hypothetical protein
MSSPNSDDDPNDKDIAAILRSITRLDKRPWRRDAFRHAFSFSPKAAFETTIHSNSCSFISFSTQLPEIF